MKRIVLVLGLLVATAALTLRAQNVRTAQRTATAKRFSIVEATIPDMRTALEQKRVTSRQIVEEYLRRIGMYEDRLHAAITVNPKALETADERDRERAAGRI